MSALLLVALSTAGCGDGGITSPWSPVQQFTAVSVSAHHRCVVAIEGDAYCWGDNYYGQIGIGRTSPRVDVPSLISSNARWASVAAGQVSSCGLTQSGLISCWGDNSAGQLGNGPGRGDSIPASPVPGPEFRMHSAGSIHACALSTEGVPFCWGYGRDRQLGQGPDESDRNLPAKVRGGHRFAHISAGSSHTCALTQDGTAWCWGGNRHGQLGIGLKGDPIGMPRLVAGDLRFTQLNAGSGRTCGVTVDGLAYCWGGNPDGALGDGTTEERDVPTPVAGGLRFRQVATANAHTCGLDEEGTLYCWGRNSSGQLGDGTRESSAEPSRVASFARFRTFSVGAFDTCAISTDGDPYCWGAGAVPRSPGPTEIPQRVVILRDQVADESEPDTTIVPAAIGFESVVTGPSWACGIDDAGKGYCWTSNGRNPFSGDGNRAGPLPQPVPGELRWSQLAAGRDFVCGIAENGAAYCWGRNYSGQLGNGSHEDSEQPVPIAGGGRYKHITVPPWGGHVCAVSEVGDAFCWGSNWGGTLGSGRSASTPIPVAVTGGIKFESVEAGSPFTCGLTPTGATYCWGQNRGEIRGPDSLYVRLAPTPVATSFRFLTLSAGSDHICGVSRDGLANYCWGNNEYAQIGTGERSYSVPIPTPTPTIPTLVTIAAGDRYTCGATQQGTAYCWGFSYYRTLGTGARFASAPTAVLGGHRFRSVSVGVEVACGITFEGELYCWGSGYGFAPRLVARP